MKVIKNIVIIDRINILRQGFKDMFIDISHVKKQKIDTTLISNYENLILELKKIKHKKRIDVVLFNIYTELEYKTNLKDIDIAPQISDLLPDSEIIIYMDKRDKHTLCNLIRDTNPSCLIIKSEALQENLNTAFISVLDGLTYYSPTVRKLVDSSRYQL